MADLERREAYKKILDIYTDRLDDLVYVNSLFTLAVFIGISFTPGPQYSSEANSKRDAGPNEFKMLVLMEVLSFSFFLYSSLTAKALKVDIRIYRPDLNFDNFGRLHINKWWRLFSLTYASIIGCIFLMVSIVYVIQVRLGKLSCKDPYIVTAVSFVILIISFTIIAFVSVLHRAILKARRPVQEFLSDIAITELQPLQQHQEEEEEEG